MRNEMEINKKANLGSIAIALGLIMLFMGNGSALNLADNFLFFSIAIIIGVVRVLFNSFKLEIKDRYVTLFFVSMLILSLYGWLISPYADPGTAKTMIMYSVLFLVELGTPQAESDLKIIEYGTILASSIFSILVLFFGNYYLSVGTGKYTYIQNFGNRVIFEPNYLALFISLGFELAIVRIVDLISEKRRLEATLLGASAILQLVAMLRTGSRMTLVGIAFFCITYILFMKNQSLKRKILLIAVIMIVLLYIAIRIGILPETMVNRMFYSSYVDNSNLKRIFDWYNGLKVMLTNPIGYGPSLTTSIIQQLTGNHVDAHNTFITFGVYYGIIGFIGFIVLWIRTMKKLLGISEYGYYAMLISMIFQANILAAQCSVTIWIFFLLCCLKISTGSRNAYK